MTDQIKDGGPAYPVGAGTQLDQYQCSTGLSLRDWFAGQALKGLIASNDPGAGDRIDELPGYAYDIAEDMLAERAKRGATHG